MPAGHGSHGGAAAVEVVFIVAVGVRKDGVGVSVSVVGGEGDEFGDHGGFAVVFDEIGLPGFDAGSGVMA